MATYEFYQDKKYTIWNRTFFSVEASTEAEAMAKAGTIAQTDLYEIEVVESCVEIKYGEVICDSDEEMSVEENGGQPTVEIFSSNGDDVADNVSGTVWDYWWQQNDLRTKGRLTGLRQSDFDPEDGYQAFIDACNNWWNAHNDTEKITIWKREDLNRSTNSARIAGRLGDDAKILYPPPLVDNRTFPK